jgi:hypothetical protein
MIVDASSTDDSTVGAGAESLPIDAAVQAAESVLTQRFGSAISLVDAEDLAGSGPATVVRARVASSPFALPRTLVIKHYPHPAPPGGPDPFAREAASYQLFNTLPPDERVCPELLAHSGDARVLVIDDLGPVPTLEDKLRGSDSRAAETALLSWARSLGRMHFTTAGREADFNALLRRLSRARGAGGAHAGSAADALPQADALSQENLHELPAMLRETFGVATPLTVLEVAQRAGERARSASYRAFSPVDLWPDNNLVTSAGVRFLDFERGRSRSALTDAAQLRVPFAASPNPLALPPGMSEAMIAAWRAEVTGLWPALADEDTLSVYLLDTQLVLVWLSTWRDLPELTGVRGAAHTGRAAALVSWWRELARQAGRCGLTAVAEHAGAVAGALHCRFGPRLELALYPAFR